MAQYENQAYLPAIWRLDGGADVTIKILDIKATEKGTALEKKMAGDSGIPQRFAGFIDFEAEMTFLVDSSALPNKSANGTFKFGSKGTLHFPVGTSGGTANNWFIVHVMLLECAYEIPNDDILKLTVKMAVDSSAVTQGGGTTAFNYPT